MVTSPWLTNARAHRIAMPQVINQLATFVSLTMNTCTSTVFTATQPWLRWLFHYCFALLFGPKIGDSSTHKQMWFQSSWPTAATTRIHWAQSNGTLHRSHHRHYRSRCNHPFLPLALSLSNLLFYTTFVLLLSFTSNLSTSDGTNISNQLRRNADAKSTNSDIMHYEDRTDNSSGPVMLFSGNQPQREHVCRSIDIRNSVSQFKKLENCTVVEGHLQIVLFDNGTTKDFENLTFPKLREITDYFMVFRIMGLQSLGKLFPNLSVIRGRTLLHNYAFVIYEMLQLQEIGLYSLTTIVRGDIRIEKNPNLCFVDTIDWSLIARNYLISENKDPGICPECPQNCKSISARKDGQNIGDSYNRLCWTASVCQSFVCHDCARNNRTCTESGQCCPEQCLGGCTVDVRNPGKFLCNLCKNVMYQNKCYEKCPNGTYEIFGRRCVSDNECRKHSRPELDINFKPYLGRCDITCPVGYTENNANKTECNICGTLCPKVCPSAVISNIASAQTLKGCTKINGSLEISITSGGGKSQISKELEENLKDLREITEYLKIARTFPIMSLNFLRHIEIIRGTKLERGLYSLVVLDNPNLQELWVFNDSNSTNKKKHILIENGRVFFHINPKLCRSKINQMREYIDFKVDSPWDDHDVSPFTNGDRTTCNVIPLEVSLWAIGSVVVGISWDNYKKKLEDWRSLLGYLIYYREAPYNNVTIFDGRDACTADEWTVLEYDEGESIMPVGNDLMQNDQKLSEIKLYRAQHEPDYLNHIIPNLKPFTQYALYIKTYTISSETKGALSKIIYFKTKPYTPSQPRNLFAKATKHNEIEVKWEPPSKPNGEIKYYIVRATRDDLATNIREFTCESVVKDLPIIPKESRVQKHWTQKDKKNNQLTVSTANNVTNSTDSQTCCSCKKEIRPIDVEQSIDFEDYIMNTVYIKKKNFDPNNTDIPEILDIFGNRRRRRDVQNIEAVLLEPTSTTSYTSTVIDWNSTSTTTTASSITSSTITTTTTNRPIEFTTEPEEKWQFMKQVFYRRDITIKDLEHFSEYTITVQACQNESQPRTDPEEGKPCSVTAITSVRTLPLAGADDIDTRSVTYVFDNSSMKDSMKSVLIKWNEPVDPNGFISSYQIEYKRITAEPMKEFITPVCVSRSHYQQNKGYTLGLPKGNFSIRIRARSLSGFSNWTDPFYINIEDPDGNQTSPLHWFIGGVLLLLVGCITVGSIAYTLRKTAKLDYVAVNPEYISAGQDYEPDPKWEIARDRVTLIHELGKGSFGSVWLGELIHDDGTMIPCAVKQLQQTKDSRVRLDFLKEADVMKSFTDCHHVVKLLGIVSTGGPALPALVLMEVMSRGDLRNYLRKNRPDNEDNPEKNPPSLEQFFKMAIEIADGMAYLASKKFVHRDLAARNCMVAEDMTVKIGDFGMTRDIYETDYYRKGGRGLLPVRWMSPESLKDGIFTTYSDVWSYGVVLWEMVTLGAQPYQGQSNEEVLKYVSDGYIMDMPEACPPVIWELIGHCWERKPKARYNFIQIVEFLLNQIDSEVFAEVSFYHRWKTEQFALGAVMPKTEVDQQQADENASKETLESNNSSEKLAIEKLVNNEKTVSEEPLVVNSIDGQLILLCEMPTNKETVLPEADLDSDSESDMLCAEDLQVSFFPIHKDIFCGDSAKGSPEKVNNLNNACLGVEVQPELDTTELANATDPLLPILEPVEPLDSNSLLNSSTLCVSLANSESLSESASSRWNLTDGATVTDSKPEPVLGFDGYDAKSLGQAEEATRNVPKSRALINGHLYNTSMV